MSPIEAQKAVQRQRTVLVRIIVAWSVGVIALWVWAAVASAADTTPVKVVDPKSGKTIEAATVDAARTVTVQSGKVTGTVLRPDGTAMANTSVKLLDASTGKTLQTVTTTAEGKYEVSNVPTGQTVLVASGPGVAAVFNAKTDVGTSQVNMIVPNAATVSGTDASSPPMLGSPMSIEGGVNVVGGFSTGMPGVGGNSVGSGISDPMP